MPPTPSPSPTRGEGGGPRMEGGMEAAPVNPLGAGGGPSPVRPHEGVAPTPGPSPLVGEGWAYS